MGVLLRVALVLRMLAKPKWGRLELVLTIVGAERGAVWRAQMTHARHRSGTLGIRLMMMSTVDLVSFVLAALPPPPARVLEVGCGAGALARAVDNAGYRVLAIDPQAPEGPIFRRTTLEKLDEAEPFEAAVACYSLHHIERLEPALDRLVSLLEPQGKLILQEFGWDRLDQRSTEWYARQQGKRSVESVLAEWRAEHEGLHGYGEMRRGLDERFAERSFEWRPYLYSCLEREDLEARERRAIAGSEIQAVGFRYVGLRR